MARLPELLEYSKRCAKGRSCASEAFWQPLLLRICCGSQYLDPGGSMSWPVRTQSQRYFRCTSILELDESLILLAEFSVTEGSYDGKAFDQTVVVKLESSLRHVGGRNFHFKAIFPQRVPANFECANA